MKLSIDFDLELLVRQLRLPGVGRIPFLRISTKYLPVLARRDREHTDKCFPQAILERFSLLRVLVVHGERVEATLRRRSHPVQNGSTVTILSQQLFRARKLSICR